MTLEAGRPAIGRGAEWHRRAAVLPCAAVPLAVRGESISRPAVTLQSLPAGDLLVGMDEKCVKQGGAGKGETDERTNRKTEGRPPCRSIDRLVFILTALFLFPVNMLIYCRRHLTAAGLLPSGICAWFFRVKLMSLW